MQKGVPAEGSHREKVSGCGRILQLHQPVHIAILGMNTLYPQCNHHPAQAVRSHPAHGSRIMFLQIIEQIRRGIGLGQLPFLRHPETAGKLVDNDELRDALKENGIGRPSTRAAIIKT